MASSLGQLNSRSEEVTSGQMDCGYPEEQKEKRVKRNERNMRHRWHTIQGTKLSSQGKREIGTRGMGKVFEEIMLKNFPELMKNHYFTPPMSKHKLRKVYTHRHIIIFIV